MPVVIRSLINSAQTLDSLSLPAWATQTRSGVTSALTAAVTAKTIQMDVINDPAAAVEQTKTVYQPTMTAGGTYTVPDDAEAVYVHAAGTLATATIHMPANPYNEQTVEFSFDAAVTSLTLDAAGATDASTTLVGALTAATAGGFAKFRYLASNPNNGTSANHGTWFRIG